MRCYFEKDVNGFYILPLLGYSWGGRCGKSLWLGWAWWLWTWQFTGRTRGGKVGE